MENIEILLVDDEKDFISTLSERLSLRGYEVSTAFDGEEALQFLGVNKVDIIVLDLKMPGMDGMEVLRKIREDDQKVRVIIQTGHGTDKEEDEIGQLGVSAFLRKPVDIEVLIGSLQDAAESLQNDVEEDRRNSDGNT
nr:response regulator [Desulfobulbaceae bacterium]